MAKLRFMADLRAAVHFLVLFYTAGKKNAVRRAFAVSSDSEENCTLRAQMRADQRPPGPLDLRKERCAERLAQRCFMRSPP
jgi:hypothetical protein